MRVSVFGLGYVGSVSAANLAADGHQVIGVDVHPWKVRAINDGRSPIVEKGLEELIGGSVGNGSLRATTSTADAVAATELSLLCVGTPSRRNGSLDLTYLERVSELPADNRVDDHAGVCRLEALLRAEHDRVADRQHLLRLARFERLRRDARELGRRPRLQRGGRERVVVLFHAGLAAPLRKGLRSTLHRVFRRCRQRTSLRVVALGQRLRRFAQHITTTVGEAHGERVRHWFETKKAGWYAVLADPQMPAMSTVLDQAHNAFDRKLFMMKGFHHPDGRQEAFLMGLAHLYNLVPYQRRALHGGQCGVEVEGGRLPTSDWMLNLQILTSGGYQCVSEPPHH